MQSRMLVLRAIVIWLFFLEPYTLRAQDPKLMDAILDRLARLETQNEALRKEVAMLREQIHPASIPLAETVEAQRSQIQEQAQFFEGAKLNRARSYQKRYTVRYGLVRNGTSWVIADIVL